MRAVQFSIPGPCVTIARHSEEVDARAPPGASRTQPRIRQGAFSNDDVRDALRRYMRAYDEFRRPDEPSSGRIKQLHGGSWSDAMIPLRIDPTPRRRGRRWG